MPVFLCYRRNDGGWHAEWLHGHLDGAQYTAPDGTAFVLRVYYDKTAPGVSDWKQLHFPSLQTSRALIVVCTPGIAKDLSRRGRQDWVYEELRWWVRQRKLAPIVVDATSEGERWLPDLVLTKWPNINRIDLRREDAETADPELVERTRTRIIDTIKQAEHATVFEDLERFRRLSRRLAVTLALSLVLLLLTGIAGAIAVALNRDLHTEQTIAIEQTRRATSNLLLTRAEFLREEHPEQLETSVLLGLEALRRSNSPDAVHSIAQGLQLLPRHVARMRHDKRGLIENLIFSPDGRYLASSARDHTARLWDAHTGSPIFVVKHDDVVIGLAFNKNGTLLATGSGDGYCTLGSGPLDTKDTTARVVKVPSGEVIRTFHQDNSILTVAFSPDGAVLATGGCDDTVRLWRLSDGKEVLRLAHGNSVSSVAFSPDGRVLATGAWDGTRLWNVSTGKQLGKLDGESIQSVHFSPDGKFLAAGTTGSNAFVWQVDTMALVLKIAHVDWAHDAKFSPDGGYVATISYDRSVLISEITTGRVVARLTADGAVLALAFSHDGKYLATSSESRVGEVWDWKEGREVARVIDPEGMVSRVEFSPDDRYLATGTQEAGHSVSLWELPYALSLDKTDLAAAACRRLHSNLTAEEWNAVLGPEPYRKTCPGLPVGVQPPSMEELEKAADENDQ